MSGRERALEQIVRDTLWMARRYADGRMTYAVETVNRAVEEAEAMGLEITPDRTHCAIQKGVSRWTGIRVWHTTDLESCAMPLLPLRRTTALHSHRRAPEHFKRL